MGSKIGARPGLPLPLKIARRPRRGWYTVNQIALVLGVMPRQVYSVVYNSGVDYMYAKVYDRKRSVIVVSAENVWKMSDWQDQILPKYKRRRSGKPDPFIMPTQLAMTEATPELKKTLMMIRDMVNKQIKADNPKQRAYNMGQVMWNIMAHQAPTLLANMKLRQDESWREWEYLRVRKQVKQRPKRGMLIPRPIEIPDHLFRYKGEE